VAEDLLTTNLHGNGSRRTLFVAGELDGTTAPLLEGAVDGALDGQGAEFWLDLSGLTFVDWMGARGIERAYDRAATLGSRLVLLFPTPAVRRVLALMGLGQVMDIRDGSPVRRASA